MAQLPDGPAAAQHFRSVASIRSYVELESDARSLNPAMALRYFLSKAKKNKVHDACRDALDAVYAIAQALAEEQAQIAREVVENGLTRRETETLAGAAKKRCGKEEQPARSGRKKKSRPFSTTLRAGNGVSVTVKFRKSRGGGGGAGSGVTRVAKADGPGGDFTMALFRAIALCRAGINAARI